MNKPDQFKAAAESHDPAGPGRVKAGLLEQANASCGISPLMPASRAATLAVIAAAFDGVGLLLLVPMLSIVTGTETGNSHPLLTQAFDVIDARTRAARITLMLAMFVALVVVRAVAVARRDINLSRLQVDYVEMIRSSLARRLAAAPWPGVCSMRA
jgi:ATP-binding cassette subfamily C protein